MRSGATHDARSNAAHARRNQHRSSTELRQHMNLLKSILHNIGVIVVGFLVALVGVGTDRLLGIASFQSLFALVLGSALLAAGFLLRVWATYHFYRRQMNVIVLSAQAYLITDGPYRFSR